MIKAHSLIGKERCSSPPGDKREEGDLVTHTSTSCFRPGGPKLLCRPIPATQSSQEAVRGSGGHAETQQVGWRFCGTSAGSWTHVSAWVG